MKRINRTRVERASPRSPLGPLSRVSLVSSTVTHTIGGLVTQLEVLMVIEMRHRRPLNASCPQGAQSTASAVRVSLISTAHTTRPSDHQMILSPDAEGLQKADGGTDSEPTAPRSSNPMMAFSCPMFALGLPTLLHLTRIPVPTFYRWPVPWTHMPTCLILSCRLSDNYLSVEPRHRHC